MLNFADFLITKTNAIRGKNIKHKKNAFQSIGNINYNICIEFQVLCVLNSHLQETHGFLVKSLNINTRLYL